MKKLLSDKKALVAALGACMIGVSWFVLIFKPERFFKRNSLLFFSGLFLVGFCLEFLILLMRWIASRRNSKIKNAPGFRLMSLVDVIYSAADIEKIFKPILADWHGEYFAALASEKIFRSRLINFSYRFRFAQAMGLSKAWTLVDLIVKTFISAISK